MSIIVRCGVLEFVYHVPCRDDIELLDNRFEKVPNCDRNERTGVNNDHPNSLLSKRIREFVTTIEKTL